MYYIKESYNELVSELTFSFWKTQMSLLLVYNMYKTNTRLSHSWSSLSIKCLLKLISDDESNAFLSLA